MPGTDGLRHDGPARSFAELLYRHRLAAGLSRLELADRVLCSENYIYRLESRDPRHRRVPSPWLVRALAEALGLAGEHAEALQRARDRLDRDVVKARSAAGARSARFLSRNSGMGPRSS